MTKISRRSMIGGVTAAIATPLLANMAEASKPLGHRRADSTETAEFGAGLLRRFHQSAVTLKDGRILITGGYPRDPQLSSSSTMAALREAQIYDPRSGTWYEAVPMQMGRARHASVVMEDGTVAVLGGLNGRPLDSVEIYDPTRNLWTFGPKLSQPMFDHTACAAGVGYLFIAGGTAGIGGIVHALEAQASQLP